MITVPAGYSIQNYLELERGSRLRHEYRCGMVYPVAMENEDHRRLRSNLGYLIATNLQRRDREFQLFMGEARCSDGDSFIYYPDLFVTVDARDFDEGNTKCYPKLIVEIVSPAKAFFAGNQKFEDYRRLNSLEEYVLIDRDTIQVECRHRVKKGNWQQWETVCYGADDNLTLRSLGTKIALAELYCGNRASVQTLESS